MKPIALFVAILMAATSAVAQRHKLGAINAETEEGKLLQSIAVEEDPARKLQLMEAFVGQHAEHEGAAWVWSQMQPVLVKNGNYDKALQAGEKLLAADPMDLEAAYQNLKASEGKKDAAAVVKWAAVTSDIARKTVETPKSADEEEEDHKRMVDYAKQIDTYTEYSLHAAAFADTNPQNVVLLTETLEQRNPQSQYIPQVLGRYAWAAREAKAVPNAVALGERAFQRGQFNEDLLLAMADHAVNAKEHDKAVLYSAKLVEVLEAKPKPEGVSDTDWERKKKTMLGLGHWMAGTTLSDQKKYAEADKELRSALPLISDNDQLMAGALFHLGLVNYQLGKGRNAKQMADAVQFMSKCAAMKSPFQPHARKNLAVMRRETGRAK